MTRAERTTVLLLLGLGVVGQLARLVWLGPGAPGEALSAAPESDRALAQQRNAASVADRPLRPGERINPNTASPRDLARLPGVGMRLAKDIVADRELRGSFGSLGDLDRVDGIGPGMLRRLEPFLLVPQGVAEAGFQVDLNHAGPDELDRLPGVGPARARAIVAFRERFGRFADPAELDRVPGIGPGLALRLRPLVTAR
ncbi:MAG TPA: ComEA family DNA-binding protein [Gemmatimonadales bacterium]